MFIKFWFIMFWFGGLPNPPHPDHPIQPGHQPWPGTLNRPGFGAAGGLTVGEKTKIVSAVTGRKC